jgi:hypothetical protein
VVGGALAAGPRLRVTGVCGKAPMGGTPLMACRVGRVRGDGRRKRERKSSRARTRRRSRRWRGQWKEGARDVSIAMLRVVCCLLSVVCCLSEVVVAGRPDVDLRLDLGLGRSLGRSSTWIGWWCLEGKEATEQQDDDVFNAVRVVLRASMQRPRLAFLAQNSGVMHTPKKDPDALLFLPRCGLLLLSVQVGPIAVRLVSL